MSELLEIVKAKLQDKIGDALLSAEQHQDFPVFIVAKDELKDTLRFLKEDPDMGFHFLTTMCGIHYPELPAEQEFWMMYQLHDMPRNRRIRVKAFMSRGDMDVPAVSDLWPTANWMERQEYDFFGFHFTGHPNLVRILNMDEMNYFPMRKEYPLEDLQRDDKSDKYFGR
jgi:NADH-quinone oxidoreductase subunit C